MDKTTLEIVTLAIAVVGAVLGIVNTWRNWSQDRVRLRVRPSYALDAMGGHNICIEVVNLSSFPITVTHLGFTVLGGANHMPIPRPLFTQGESLPVRLEARTSCTVLVPLGTLQKGQVASIDKAYASTACGLRVLGDSPALRDVVHAAATTPG